MELAGYIAVARRWWTTLLIATWVAGLAGYVIASGLSPTYEGITRLLVGPVVAGVDVTRAAGALSYTYAELATSAPALEATRSGLGLPPTTAIVARAIPNETTRFLEIRAQSGDPQLAAEIANSLADTLLTRESPSVVLPEGQLTLIEPAIANPVPIAPQVTLIAIIAAGTGLLGASVLVLLVEYFGNTINSVRDLTAVAPIASLGSVSLGHGFRPTPEVPTIVEGRPDSKGSSAIRMLATKIAAPTPKDGSPVVLFVGTSAHDGSADLAIGVATVLSQMGRRVVLVDVDAEGGEVSGLLGIDTSPGLAEIRASDAVTASDLVMTRPRGPAVLGRGRLAHEDFMDPETAQRIVNKLARDYDIVVLSAAPLQASGDALVWARQAPSAVVVALRDHAKRDDVAFSIQNLASAGTTVIGAVLIENVARPKQSRRRTGVASGARPNASSPAGRRREAYAVPAVSKSSPISDTVRSRHRSDEATR
ncbi:MAG: hypothetical protein ABIO99_11110 [Candidatus Limnocylindria bacterium]